MKKRIIFYKKLIHEILEALCTFCQVLNSMTEKSEYKKALVSHYIILKNYSQRISESLEGKKD